MTSMRSLIAAGLTVLALAGAPRLVSVAAQVAQPQAPAPAVVHFGSWGLDLTGMDRAVKPGDDFDRYVNGAWLARTEIPADQASTGVAYDVFNMSQTQIRDIIEKAPAD